MRARLPSPALSVIHALSFSGVHHWFAPGPHVARGWFCHHVDTAAGSNPTPPLKFSTRSCDTAPLFAYSTDAIPPQGRWAISGLDLPDDVLAKVYGDNARRLLPRLAT